MKISRLLVPAMLAVLLAACQDTSSGGKPSPVAMTQEAVGYYCQMYVLDHAGPKAQIHLARIEAPLWFAQVSDAVAYLKDPDQIADIEVVYVNDMGSAPSWAEVGADNWIDAATAFFVIESKQMGGMGMPEAVPFSVRAEADAFALKEGGRVMGLLDIPEAYVHPHIADGGPDGEASNTNVELGNAATQ